jgi:transcriptional regulator with XRE-family HTH domain
MKLADYLTEKGIKANAFAKMIGADRSTVGRWLKPRDGVVWRPDWETIKKIEKATDGLVTANDFVDPPNEAAA